MSKKNKSNKRVIDDVLPVHTKTAPDELMAMILLEDVLSCPLYKSESPDLYNDDRDIGIEVTRAFPREYEHYNGIVLREMFDKRSDIATKGFVVSFRSVCNIIFDRIVHKIEKLTDYKHFAYQYLYVKAFLFSWDIDWFSFTDCLNNLKMNVLKYCDEHNLSEKYSVIFIEGQDLFLIWDWNNNTIKSCPDIANEQQKRCWDVFHLVKDEEEFGVSAVDKTPFKISQKLFFSVDKSNN